MSSCQRSLEEYMNMNNAPNSNDRGLGKNKLVAILVSVVLFILVNLLVGPYLWNEVVRPLCPALGKAGWYDTVLLNILLSLILPTN